VKEKQTSPDVETRFSHRVSRAHLHPPRKLFPVDEWNMVVRAPKFVSKFVEQGETIFSVSNGYLGLRGDHEEGFPSHHPGVFLNGFYETWPIVYGEEAYGFAKTGQTIVNVTDAKVVKLFVDDEPFELENADIREYGRRLDMRAGTLDRTIVWETPAGKRIRVKSRRLVSFVHRHLAALCYEVIVLNDNAHLIFSSEMMTRKGNREQDADPRRSQGFDGRVLVPKLRHAEDRRVLLCHETRNSRLRIACGMDHEIDADQIYACESKCERDLGSVFFSVVAVSLKHIRLVKYMAYHHSDQASPEELRARTERTLRRGLDIGFDGLLDEQRETLDDFWRRSDIEIEGDPSIQQAVRFNLFQLFQATARVEGYGVPAKGLTGQGYEGHYFWDSEIYVLPFVIYTAPRSARNLLRFRYAMLDQARARAGELSHRGALYPWRTINGEEASAYYAAGTAQYHINADIAYAIRKYYQVTGDMEFLTHGGAEVIVETARLWVDLGNFSEALGGAFCINGVTGPDEYTAVVNNNRFTNMMARENLRLAVSIVEYLQNRHPEDFEQLAAATGLDLSELEDWTRAADHMYLPVDEKTGIHPQDDSFLEKEIWDCAQTAPEKFPLLLHYHPLVLYRHQVIKQADVVMAMFLLGHDSSQEEKKRNFDYYDPLTTRDSSLSSCIQSIVAAEIGYADKAFDYFVDAALVDLADIGGNVIDGVHIASMGGTWMALVYGFGGMRDHDGRLSFRPRLPERWSRLCFRLTVRGQRIEVDVDREGTTYTLREGPGLAITHEGEELRLSPDSPVRLPANAES
jgi:alpha,alpha-trehalose phosphorylase